MLMATLFIAYIIQLVSLDYVIFRQKNIQVNPNIFEIFFNTFRV